MFNNNEILVSFNELAYGEEFRNICDIYPIVSAKKTEKSWWTTMKSHYDIFLSSSSQPRPNPPPFKTTQPTIKYCPGIFDFINYGYIMPAWQDFQFWVDDDGNIEWQVPPTMRNIGNISIHPQQQVDTCPIMDNTASYILKLVSPWFIRTSKGTSVNFCKPFYHYSNDFDVCPGVLDSDMNAPAISAVSVFIRFNVRNEVIHIKAGQPLLQFIPFKRINWKLKQVEVDKNFRDLISDYEITLNTRFQPEGDSLTKFRHDNSNKKFE